MPPSTGKTTYTFGRNTMEVDAETAWLKLYEPWTVPLLEQVIARLRVIHYEYGRVFVVLEPFIDNPMPAEARRYLSESQKDYSFTEAIFIKRSVILRGVVALMHRARVLFGGRAPTAPRFVNTAEEARALLAELRKNDPERREAR